MTRIDQICDDDICPNCDQLYGSEEEVGKLTMLCDEQRGQIERLTRELEECRKLLRKIIEKQGHNHTWLGTAAGQEWLADAARAAGGE